MNAPDGLQRIAAYCRASGLVRLAGREGQIERSVLDLIEAMGEKVAIGSLDSLYTYRVPMLTDEGTCAVADELAPVPYDLTAILGGRSEQNTRRLALLERLVERAQETTGCEWLGIYQRRADVAGQPVLVKLSYVGRPSRAEFPLSAEFAAQSTNSSVGLTGQAIVIDDVQRHVSAGGAFYVCDAGVRAEACLPILDARLQVAGIVDAEAYQPSFFGADRLCVLAALCIVAASALP